MYVYKFGGASLSSPQSFRNVKNIIMEKAEQPLVIVVSACGNTTNKLERLIEAYVNDEAGLVRKIFNEIMIDHINIANNIYSRELMECSQIHTLFNELECRFTETKQEDPDYVYDKIIGFGELLSSTILSEYLNNESITNSWFDIREVIRTSNDYREGRVDWGVTGLLALQNLKPILNKPYATVVTQGFIGKNEDGNTVSLGRDGSDYTASIIAWCLHANSVTIWKDVPGVLNADPKWFSKTELIPSLPYSDAVELAFYGANVIHPKTLKPLQNKGIPLYVRSFVDTDITGTTVSNNSNKLAVPAYIFKVNQILITISSRDFSFIAEENLRDIFDIFNICGLKIHVMQNSAISFSCCTNNNQKKIPLLIKLLKKKFIVSYDEKDIELITILAHTNEVVRKICEEKEILLEQKSAHTAQIVVRNKIPPEKR